jgi:GNAT superfamily N-acetyltransferase
MMMAKKVLHIERLLIEPLTEARWDDFEKLFGPNGACAGCWCMWWRMTSKEWTTSGKEGHKKTMRTIVHSEIVPGLIAYADGIPAAWVAVEPREHYERLKTSEILAPVDDLPVWSITCFFIQRDYRRLGLMEKLINTAVDYAKSHGAQAVEAYPYDIHEKKSSGTIYTGVASAFRDCGFVEVIRRSEQRPIMRKMLS